MAGEEGAGAVTIAERAPGILAIFCTALAAVLISVVPFGSKWMRQLPAPFIAAYLVVVAVGSIWAIYRGRRMSVRIDDGGVTVRNFFRTHRLSWAEVSCLTDGLTYWGESTFYWALRVVPRDGRPVTARGTMSAGRPSPQTLAAIRQAAGRHGMPAQVTGLLPGERVTRAVLVEGTPASIGFHPDPSGREGLRYFDGQDWSPFLFLDADPASSRSDDPGTLPRVWSPLNMLTVDWQPAEPDAEPDELTADQGGQPGCVLPTPTGPRIKAPCGPSRNRRLTSSFHSCRS
jgi:hypothetical protein